MKYTIRMLFFIEALACAHEVQQLPTARCLQAPAQPYDTCLAFGTIGGRGLETVDAAKSTMPGRRVKGPLDESTDGDCAGLPGSRWWAGLGGIGAHCTISACSRRIHSCPICVTVPGLSVVRVRVVAISKNGVVR